MAVQESRTDSSLLCANLVIDFIIRLTEVTKIFLQAVLFNILCLHVHIYICMAVVLPVLVGGLRTEEKVLALSIWFTVYKKKKKKGERDFWIMKVLHFPLISASAI